MLANPLKLSTIVRKLALFCRGKTKIQMCVELIEFWHNQIL